MASSSSPAASWSDLPADTLRMVASLLPSFDDLLRFRSVCRSWRDAAAASPPPPLPYLLCPDDADDLTRCFHSLADGKVHKVRFPADARQWRCCGSSHGWLAMADLDAGICLFNPLSGARLELPPLTTLPQVLHVARGPETEYRGPLFFRPHDCSYPWYVSEFAHGSRRAWGAEFFRDAFVRRAMASPVTASDPSGCTVMLLYEHSVAYARPGDEAWTSLWNRSSPRYDDLIHHENKFYLLDSDGAVSVIDFGGAGRGPRVEECISPPPDNGPCLHGGGRMNYLSVARPSGEILVVRKHLRRVGFSLETEYFEVYKLELGREGRRWEAAESLGGCTLFLSSDCSMSVDASQGAAAGCMPNCIHFREEDMWNCIRNGLVPARRMGIYHVKDRSIQRLPFSGGITQNPVWITPTT